MRGLTWGRGPFITEALKLYEADIEITPPLASDKPVATAADARAEAVAHGLSAKEPTTCKFGRLAVRGLSKYGVNLSPPTPAWVCVQLGVRSTDADPLGATSPGNGQFANISAFVKDANTSVLFYYVEGSI